MRMFRVALGADLRKLARAVRHPGIKRSSAQLAGRRHIDWLKTHVPSSKQEILDTRQFVL